MKTLTKALSRLRKLKRLSLVDGELVTGKIISCLKSIKELEQLNLSGCKNITTDSIRSLITEAKVNNPKLKKIILGDCNIDIMPLKAINDQLEIIGQYINEEEEKPSSCVIL
jgi:hypothetical protein